jgi:hypothetical protein
MGLVKNYIRKAKENFTSFDEIQLFIGIFLFSTILPLLLKLLSVNSLMNLITPKKIKHYKEMSIEDLKGKLVRYTDYILALNFLIYKQKCLKRSIVLYHFLRKAGLNVSICFGVKFNKDVSGTTSKERLEGHAWLEYNGEIYLERDKEMTGAYKITYRYPDENKGSARPSFYRS